MTREEYIELRNDNQLGHICYTYYVEKAEQKGLEIYDIDFFIKAFNIWITFDKGAVAVATSHYDNLFVVQTLISNNKEIKYT